ncbi:MAG: lipoyl(octanoyl) transferase LipB [Candidatus Scalindua sp.]
MKKCLLLKLGMVEYGEAWQLQKRLFTERMSGRIEDILITLQHPPTYTLGRRDKNVNHFLIDKDQLRNRGFSIYRVDRGGAVTYHGPGQIVCYPIIGMKAFTEDYYFYLRMLEEVMIKTLRAYKIKARRIEGLTGVWVGEEKVGFTGVRIVAGTTMHGFSLNVINDLSPFNMIVPCGIENITITSLSKLLKANIDIRETEDLIIRNFNNVFKTETHITSIAAVLEQIDADSQPAQPQCIIQ